MRYAEKETWDTGAVPVFVPHIHTLSPKKGIPAWT
jgi:hypothetical protein